MRKGKLEFGYVRHLELHFAFESCSPGQFPHVKFNRLLCNIISNKTIIINSEKTNRKKGEKNKKRKHEKIERIHLSINANTTTTTG